MHMDLQPQLCDHKLSFSCCKEKLMHKAVRPQLCDHELSLSCYNVQVQLMHTEV